MSTEEPEGGPPPDEPLADGFVLRMLLGSQLRQLREAAGVTPDRAGYEIRASRSKISRMETGRVGFKARDLEDLLTFYGMTDEQSRSRFLDLAGQSKRLDWWTSYSDVLPGWFETYLGLESVCSTIRTFELQFVHGLFQTEDYARAVTRLSLEPVSPAETERRVGLRVKRQDLLTKASPPKIWSVMDEAVLRRPVGGAAVMRAQLRHLIEAAKAAGGDAPGRPLRPGRSRRRERVVHHLALRRALPAGRGLHRAAHRRRLPGAALGRRALPGGHGPAEHEALPPAASARFIEKVAAVST